MCKQIKKAVPSFEDTARKDSFFSTDIFLGWSDPPRTETSSACIGVTNIELIILLANKL